MNLSPQSADTTNNSTGRLETVSVFPEKIKSGFVLVLSGGVVRGVGHLGFLAACQEKKLPVKAIVATSAGAIAGAVYQSPKCSIEEALKRLQGLTLREMFRLSPGGSGFLDPLRTSRLLGEMIGHETDFSELSGPLAVGAVSLQSGNLALLSEGVVARAVAASSALPPFFKPVRIGSNDYIDGGVLSILPVLAAQQRWPEHPLVAVNVNDIEDRQGQKGIDGWLEVAPASAPVRMTRWSILMHPLRFLAMGLSWTVRLEASSADWYVGISAGRFSLTDRANLDRIYRIGYDAGKQFSGMF
uniref:PNPLA domain-containing protein n=1 Tax=Leptospirillum ferriphilum TaxID=178606 RepID=A0A7C3R4L4_9BACT